MTLRSTLIAAMLVGPIAAATDLLASYYMIHPAQASGSKLGLHVATVIAFLVTTAAAIWSVSQLRRRDYGLTPAERFLAIMSVAMDGFFALLIGAYAIPTFILHVTD